MVLQSPNQLKTGTVADVSQTGIAVTTEIALENLAILGAVKHGAPGFQFVNPGRGFFGMQFGHAPIIDVLAAAHGIGKMDFPAIPVIHIAHGRGHAALRHDRMCLSEKGFANESNFDACC